MSKTKKIISMLLAVVMVMSVAPVSGFAATISETGFSYEEPTVTPISYTVSTAATTEVIRVASGSGKFTLPDSTNPPVIVKATPSGIPETAGAYKDIAYAGETPATPQVVFSITGATLENNPTVVSSITGINATYSTKTTSGNTNTYYYNISGGGENAYAGTDVVFEITYTLSGNQGTYKAYAYSHIENIIIMNGFISYRFQDQSGNDAVDQRHSLIGQFQSKNMYTRMNGADFQGETDPNATSVSNRILGFINYGAVTPWSGATLLGCGSEEDVDTESTDAYAAGTNSVISGTKQAALIKSSIKSDTDTQNMCHNNDTNRGEPVIFLDYNETIDSINFRFTLQNAEQADFSYAILDNITFYNPGASNFGRGDTSVNIGTVMSTAELYTAGYNYGKGGDNQINAPTGSSNNYDFSDYAMAKFTGGGPRPNEPDLNTNYTAVVKFTSYHSSQQAPTFAAMNIIFRSYSTEDLRNVYDGILRGTGEYTTKNLGTQRTFTFNRGANPRAELYNIDSVYVDPDTKAQSSYATGVTDWTQFDDAFKHAGSILARPDAKQADINAAVENLYKAYNNLEGFNPTVTVKVMHCLSGSETPLVINGKAVQWTDTVNAGSRVTAYAANIKGYYLFSSNSTISQPISGAESEEVIKFYYKPNTYNLTINTGNPAVASKMVSYDYNTLIDVDAIARGEREGYTFEGWFTKDENGNWEEPALADFNITEDTTIFGRWYITPLKVYAKPVVNTGVSKPTAQLASGTMTDIKLLDETTAVSFNAPTGYVSNGAVVNGNYIEDGYLFAGYFEDEALTTPATWPKSFKFGDSDLTIYARWIDVNKVVAFETNGGIPVPPNISFNAGDTINAPTAPTKKGYSFAGWWTEDLITKQYFENGTETMPNNTGFLAYAKWEANPYTISFEMGDPTSDFDTTNNQMSSLTGLADQPIDPDDIPATPCRLGKSFAQWIIKGTNTVFTFDKYPTEDITLVPIWTDTKYSAFVSIGAYEKLSGVYEELVAPNGDKAPGKAQVGDVVTFRMTSLTNFYNGSSAFVFMYDKNFFELVNEGSDAFKLNTANEYVSGIDATSIGVTNSKSLASVWPTEGETATLSGQYGAMMVTIDPTVTSNNYNCEPMGDGTWLVEFQLRVKEGATGSGKVYMHNDWTRTADNIMGTMFYGWAETGEATVAETYNSVVTPNLDKATATIQIDETPAVNRTLYANPYGGQWSDGTSNVLEFTGREETEFTGFVAPTREGYTIEKDANGNNIWYKLNDDNTVDESVTWIEGYYASEETDGFTFVPAWKGETYTVNYYVEYFEDPAALEFWGSEEVVYGNAINGPFYPVDDEKPGYDFARKWVDEDGHEFIPGTTLVPLGGVDLYAVWVPGQVDFTVTIHYGDNTTTRTMSATTDSDLYVDVTAGPDPNATYILYSSLPNINGYEIDPQNPDNQALATTPTKVNGDGSTNINVYYKAKTITFTFDANGGAWADGTTTDTLSGDYGSTCDMTVLGEPIKAGYNFKGWSTNSSATNGTTSVKYNRDVTYYAAWEPKSATITFDATLGNFGVDSEGAEIKTKTAAVVVGNNITAPTPAPALTGYNFLGWSTDGSTVIGTTGTLGTAVTDAAVTYLAVWEKAKYDVTYNVDGALHHGEEDVEFDSTFTVLAKPTEPTGYKFDGWYYAGTKYEPGTEFKMPAGDVVFDAYMDAQNYDAVFYLESDSTEAYVTESVTFGEAIPAPSEPSKDGHSFLGWTDTPGSNSVVALGSMDTTGKTFYAVWKAEIWNYTIEFYYMDTEGKYPETPVAAETITTSGTVGSLASVTDNQAPATKEGFTRDDAESELSGTITVDPALVLKVYYERNQRTITWTDDAGTTTATYYYGETITVPTPAEKEGYGFTAWTPSVDITTMPDENKAYTAKYDPKPYPVTFYKDANKAETVYSGNVNYGATLNGLAANPTTNGYEFKGWAYEGTTTVLNLANETVPVGGVTLVGIWQIESYTVNFRANEGVYDDGTDLKTTTVTFGDPVVAPEVPDRDGFTFDGWSPALPDAIEDGSAVRNHVAQWIEEEYTVFIVIDKDNVWENKYKYGDPIDQPTEDDLVKVGYTFQYWTDADGNQVEIPDEMEDLGKTGASVTYTAYYTKNSHKAIFNSEGSLFEEKTYSYDDPVSKPANKPVKAGWTFTAWVGADGTEYTDEKALPNMGDADVTYTAKFTINSHKAIFNSEGALFEEKTYNYGAPVAKPTAKPEKTGWTFAAWVGADGTEYTDEKALPNMGDADAVYTAKFTVNTYNVTWKFDNGDVDEAEQYTYEAPVNKPTNPVKTGYTFTGWSDGANFYAKEDNVPAMGAADVVYTAQYTINTYNVTWKFDNGDADSVEQYTYEAPVNKPTDPQKTGNTFSGWSDGENFYAKGTDVPAMGAADITYTAQWNINSYTAVFKSEGETVESKSYAYNTAVNKPVNDPIKVGHKFVAWVDEATGTKYYEGDALPAMGTGNVTYIAEFEILKYTVIFDAGLGVFASGDTVYTIYQDYNTIATKPADPDREGYAFKGWTTTENGGVDDVVTVPSAWQIKAEDITYYAVWTIEKYTVTFLGADLDPANPVYEVELEYGTKIQRPEAYDAAFVNPELEHYTFEGWSLTEVALEQSKEDVLNVIIDFAAEDAPTVPEGGITIYPAFARVVVTLVPVEGSSAQITLDENAADPKIGYVTGLETLLDEETLLSKYLTVEGDGTLVVTPTKFGEYGTGTTVEVLDNVTEEVVEIHYLIIFGDVNGDGGIDATDASIIRSEVAGRTSWSNVLSEDYDYCMVLAADVVDDNPATPEKEGLVDTTDATAIEDTVLMAADIDQQTGSAIFYY